MVQTISLRHVLQEAVATPYRNLVTRATGAAVRGRIEASLAAGSGHTTLLDFSGVECLDLSCADEIVAKLLLAAATGDRVLVLAGVRDEQREALEHVLAHHRLAVAACFRGSDTPDVLGWITSDAREAFADLRQHGPADPSMLAARLTWLLGRAAAALDDLAGHRIAQQVGGVYHVVTLP
jgi:anti-anti-sigma regulatory factor